MAEIWGTATLGASGGVYGLLAAFAILNGNRPIYVYAIFPVKARWVAIFWFFISFVNAFNGSNGVAEFAHLGGGLFGLIYLRYLPRYGLQTAASEGLFGLRNAYYRWKRRRAARKFEVYMRKTNRREYFDDKGNYRGPRLDKDNDHWVN
jgi:membrane associated rhomboid family serine protease